MINFTLTYLGRHDPNGALKIRRIYKNEYVRAVSDRQTIV